MSIHIWHSSWTCNSQRLEQIVWPHVRTKIEDRISEIKQQHQSNSSDPKSNNIIIVEAALLLETDWHDLLDGLWVVQSSPAVAVQRLKDNRGLTEEEALTRINAQQLRRGIGNGDDEKFCEDIDNGLVTKVITNDGTLMDLQNALEAALHDPAFFKRRPVWLKISLLNSLRFILGVKTDVYISSAWKNSFLTALKLRSNSSRQNSSKWKTRSKNYIINTRTPLRCSVCFFQAIPGNFAQPAQWTGSATTTGHFAWLTNRWMVEIRTIIRDEIVVCAWPHRYSRGSSEVLTISQLKGYVPGVDAMNFK